MSNIETILNKPILVDTKSIYSVAKTNTILIILLLSVMFLLLTVSFVSMKNNATIPIVKLVKIVCIIFLSTSILLFYFCLIDVVIVLKDMLIYIGALSTLVIITSLIILGKYFY